MSAYFSPTALAIYPEILLEEYIDAGTLPDDCLEITDEEAELFHPSNQPEGKILGVVEDMPAWVDVPPPSHDELVTIVEQQKKTLLDAANNKIAPLQDALDLDMATDDEAESLLAWKKYRVLVNRVNPDEAPDIEWPAAPQ